MEQAMMNGLTMTDTLDAMQAGAIAAVSPNFGRSVVKEIRLFDFLNRGVELFGKDRRDWVFVCPRCGNVQSTFAVKGRNPELTLESIEHWIHASCEGRRNKNADPRLKRGCDWTLGGLLQMHEVEIVVTAEDIGDPRCGYTEPTRIPVFRFKE